ncbi:hypothetical protein CYMTET_11894 [Cymbomonas tetramitiformis]|uniref:Uncharacterized protein n=1 Tax=Cymbomonas tetramitiformis TaxID=36881 RepID=A0AAE0GLQ1_9CHLO|nr:hypothetical protein CYMTET_11894 [Cymbomonas tetramitiformis]
MLGPSEATSMCATFGLQHRRFLDHPDLDFHDAHKFNETLTVSTEEVAVFVMDMGSFHPCHCVMERKQHLANKINDFVKKARRSGLLQDHN